MFVIDKKALDFAVDFTMEYLQRLGIQELPGIETAFDCFQQLVHSACVCKIIELFADASE